MLALGLGLIAGACSISFPMASLFPDEETTSAITPVSPLSPELGGEDWRLAKRSLALALDPRASGASVDWDNPATGVRGSFMPVGQPIARGGQICRAFLATVIGQAATSTLQGSACRPSGGEWTIEDVTPWHKAG